MSQDDATPKEPARPEIDAALLREVSAGAPAADEPAPRGGSTEDPELPGVPNPSRGAGAGPAGESLNPPQPAQPAQPIS